MAAPLTCVSTQREKLANELPACRQAARRWRSVYPDVGMAKVRLRRYKASEQLADGIDPAVAKGEEKQGCVNSLGKKPSPIFQKKWPGVALT